MRGYTPKPKTVIFYNVSVFFLKIGLALWAVETLFFLYRDGFHWNAIHDDEKKWDFIAGLLMDIGFMFMAIAMMQVVKFHVAILLEDWKQQNGLNDNGNDQ